MIWVYHINRQGSILLRFLNSKNKASLFTLFWHFFFEKCFEASAIFSVTINREWVLFMGLILWNPPSISVWCLLGFIFGPGFEKLFDAMDRDRFQRSQIMFSSPSPQPGGVAKKNGNAALLSWMRWTSERKWFLKKDFKRMFVKKCFTAPPALAPQKIN